MNDEELKTKRIKLYFAPILPINKKLIETLELSKINVSLNQAYVYNKDVHKELFCQVLLNFGKKYDDKPSYEIVPITRLIDDHFETGKSSDSFYIRPAVLFILYTSNGLENSYTGPIINKVIEDRKAYNKKTFVFYKGFVNSLSTLKLTSIDEIVDFNNSKPKTKGGVIL